MTERRLALGKQGEEVAAEYLRKEGVKILERNFRTPVGEIDIIGRKGKYLLFVEVKSRRSIRCGAPQEAVGPAKQRQIIRTAQWYLGKSGSGRLQPRFDVIAVLFSGDHPRVEHFTDAFGL